MYESALQGTTSGYRGSDYEKNDVEHEEIENNIMKCDCSAVKLFTNYCLEEYTLHVFDEI